MSAIGLLNLNLGVPDHYEIDTKFTNPALGLPPGGLSIDPPAPVADRWAIPDNDFTQMLGLAPGRDRTQEAMQGVWQNPDQPLSARGVAFALDNALQVRDFFVTPLKVIHGAGSALLNVGEWAVNQVSPSAEVASNTPGVAARLGDAASQFWDAPTSEKGPLLVDGANAFGNAFTASIRKAWNEGRVGRAGGEFALQSTIGPGAYLGARSVANAARGAVNDGLAALDRTVGSVSETQPVREVWPGFGPLGNTPLQGEALNVPSKYPGPTVEGPTWRQVTIYPPSTTLPRVADQHAAATVAYSPSTYARSDVPRLADAIKRAYTIDIRDENAISAQVEGLMAGGMSTEEAFSYATLMQRGGASIVPNWRGQGAYDWALARFGPMVDSNGQPVTQLFDGVGLVAPNVPSNTAYLSNVFASENLLGGGRQAVQIGMRVANELGQNTLTGYTTSPYALGRFKGYDAPGPFRITDASALPGAPDRIWNYWTRAVDPLNKTLPDTWAAAFGGGHDNSLIAAAWDSTTLRQVNPATGVSDFDRMMSNLAPLYENNPISALNRQPIRDQLLLPPDVARFGFEWDLRNSQGFLGKSTDVLRGLYQPESLSRFNALDLRNQGIWNDASYALKRTDESIIPPQWSGGSGVSNN